jgi:gliding-associated putative ABC transporter substrate-binding component GldG
MRFDLTEDDRFTLSLPTEKLVQNLDELITVKAYFSENLPQNIISTKKDFKDLLIEYSNASNGNFVYEFVDLKDEKAENEAIQNGIRPILIDIREKDQIKQQKSFLGAVILKGNQKEPIPVIQPGVSMEYNLSSAIKKLTITEKPKIAYLQGHQESPLADIGEVNENLSNFYTIEPIDLVSQQLTKDYKTLMIVNPKDTIDQNELFQIEQYYNNGGNVFIALNSVEGDFKTLTGKINYTGLDSWLIKEGIEVKNEFVVDENCSSVSVQQQQGFFNFVTQVKFPYIPLVSNYSGHVITKGLETIYFPFVSYFNIKEDSSANSQTKGIIFTSNKSGAISPPLYFNIEKKWTTADFPLNNLSLAVIKERKDISGNKIRIVAIGDGDFMVNQKTQQGNQQLPPNHLNLALNSIEWLTDQTGLIAVRNKGVNNRPINPLEDGTKTMIKYFNFLFPIFLAIGFGFFRFQMNSRIRLKRMADIIE